MSWEDMLVLVAASETNESLAVQDMGEHDLGGDDLLPPDHGTESPYLDEFMQGLHLAGEKIDRRA